MELKKVNKKLDAVFEYISKNRKNENLFQFPIDIDDIDLAELMLFLFTPRLIFKFNMTGRFNANSFKKLKVYKILQGTIRALIVK